MEVMMDGMIINGILTLLNLLMFIASSSVAIYAWVELKSFMKSTHKIEYIPFEPPVGKDGKPKPLEESDPLKEWGIVE